MLENVAGRVRDELTGLGYSPRFHAPENPDDPFSISIDGAGFDLSDLKNIARISEELGVGLHLDDRGRITLS